MAIAFLLQLRLWIPLLALLVLLFVSNCGVASARRERANALFVFGDSYADTGNHNAKARNLSNESWLPPYGSTFPGKPSGRFSDGFVSTDCIGRLLGLRSIPVPFHQITSNPVELSYGINFAFGGSGVFETYGPQYPTIGKQIKELELLHDAGLYTKTFFAHTPLLMVVSGNDYAAYLLKNGSIQGLPAFVSSVNRQLEANLIYLIELGFKRFLVTNLPPVGCLPKFTAARNYESCSDAYNELSILHNSYLSATAQYLNKTRDVKLLILDYFTAFIDIITNPRYFGNMTHSLKPCCLAEANHNCSDVDSSGRHLYSLCSSPEGSFLWDGVHPTHAAWGRVVARLSQSILRYIAAHS